MPTETQKPASKRDRILAAAAQVIGERGLDAFVVKDITALAGVTPQLTYYYFPNRQALVRGVFQYAAERAPSVNLLHLDREASGYEALRGALHAEFDDSPEVRDLNLIWNEVTALPIEDPELAEAVRRATERWNEQVTIGILRGLADGSIVTAAAPQAVAELLTALVEGLSQRWLAGLISPDDARRTLDVVLSTIRRA
jgi:AcrR family transcriptional regulator